MRVARYFDRHPNLACAVWIALCFLLTSAVYLSWLYRLVALSGAAAADWLSMVVGYLCQGAGALLAVPLLRGQPDARRATCRALVAFAVVSVPALATESAAAAIAFGMVMNLLCGVIAGLYLRALAVRADENRRGVVFGGGYAAATAAVGLLALIGKGGFLASRFALPSYLALAAALAVVSRLAPEPSEHPRGESPADAPPDGRRILLACTVVIMLSLVKNLGACFPSADIETGLRVELPRLLYAVALAAAGLINDRSRRHGAICAAAAMVVPFILLGVAGEPVSSAILWGLDYLFYGFFSVYRAVLFVDLARRFRAGDARRDPLGLATVGLAAGRLGDALGTGLGLLLAGNRIALVAVTAALFIAALLVFFRLYQALYEPEVVRQRSEREVFDAFAIQHDLSTREREVLRLVLAERANGEIAEALFVSESTVKYHVHNLLQKTGCRNRGELMRKFAAALYPHRPELKPVEPDAGRESAG